jgi:hypothetical protein
MTPSSVSDDLPNNAWHLEVVREEWNDGQTERDEVYVYVAVGRYGIAVLQFRPDTTTGARLLQVDYIKTPNGMGGMRVADDGTGDLRLRTVETHVGLRAYVHPQ